MPRIEDLGTPYEVAVNDVRALVRPDGADFEVVDIDPEAGAVHLKLLVEDASCVECVMPKDILQQIALDVIARQVPPVTCVTIDDPREGGAPPG